MVGILIFLLLVIVSGFDLICRIIPVSLCLMIAGVGLVWQMSQHVAQVPIACLQAITIFGLLVPFCARGIIGGGDAKLLAALAIGVTFHELLRMLFATVIAGGVLGCVYLLLSYVPARSRKFEGGSRLCQALMAERERIRARESIPYGLAITLGWIGAILLSRLERATWPFGL